MFCELLMFVFDRGMVEMISLVAAIHLKEMKIRLRREAK